MPTAVYISPDILTVQSTLIRGPRPITLYRLEARIFLSANWMLQAILYGAGEWEGLPLIRALPLLQMLTTIYILLEVSVVLPTLTLVPVRITLHQTALLIYSLAKLMLREILQEPGKWEEPVL